MLDMVDFQGGHVKVVHPCPIGWSEKSESCNCQKYQAVSEPHYPSEFRTVDEIEIRPFFICEIVP